MDPREMESLVQRLVHNPHDQEAITYAHQAGQTDPRSYAMLLEKVGTASADPAIASHFLSEAANVWVHSLSDAHRAARALMIAIDRDPTQSVPAERLAELYRENGDVKALIALLERRAKALAPLAASEPELAYQLATIHEELGRLWSEPPLSQTAKAIENYKRAIECDARSQYAIYALRELYKSLGDWAAALPYFELEQELLDDDPERQLALYQDEAEVRKNAGDRAGAAAVLRAALLRDGGQDPTLKQLLATAVFERVQAGELVHGRELSEAAQLFNELAEQYPGEYGYSYAACSLEVDPGNDRAVQLLMYYAEELACEDDAAPKVAAYLRANANGVMSGEAREFAARVTPVPPSPSEPEAAVPVPATAAPALAEPVAAEPPAASIESGARLRALLESAEALARRGKKNDAAAAYRSVLEVDPAEPEALGFVEAHLRQGRKYAELRDVLVRATRQGQMDADARAARLREIAGLCEAQLRDIEGAINAWQQLVTIRPDDDGARGQLKRLLERAGKWDELAALLEREAEGVADAPTRIALEKGLAKLHEQKRKDPAAAGEVWARIALLGNGDEAALWTAIKHFDKAQRPELAARAIEESAALVPDQRARVQLFKRQGELFHKLGAPARSGDAFARAAELGRDPVLWEAAEHAFAEARAPESAARAVAERAALAAKPKERAALLAKEAAYLALGGRDVEAVQRLEQATDLEPENASYASELENRYTAQARFGDLATHLQRRAQRLPRSPERTALRRRAAVLLRDTLHDPEGARACLRLLVEDEDDADALRELADDAEARGKHDDAVDYLRRLTQLTHDRAEKTALLVRQAKILDTGLDDPEGAIARYEEVLAELDPTNLDALRAVAALCERSGDAEGRAHALERHLSIVQELDVARQLADLYQHELARPADAVRVLDIVLELDEEDFDALERACRLCEELEDWPRVCELLAALMEVEADESELSRMTRRLAGILHEQLDKNDEALAVLLEAGDRGDAASRKEYVQLGDELGWSGIVATKLVDWHLEALPGKERQEALRGAFERFLRVGREADAASVARELSRTRPVDPEFARELERIAINLRDFDSLAIAHDLLVSDLTGPARAEELVRQAEVLIEAGVEPDEALQHGEQGLTSVAPGEAESLLVRLSHLATSALSVIDLYERQISRCKAPGDRLRALGRAAAVAEEYGAHDRARGLFELALSGTAQPETMSTLEAAAFAFDEEQNAPRLTRILAEAMAGAGQGMRDGGRTRGALLRRAARLAQDQLADSELAFRWLGDALIAHVDEEGLDALERVAESAGEPARIELVLTRVLVEVSDGPLVRKLLERRAGARKRAGDRAGAAQDLKKLHELAPADQRVAEELSHLYTELADYRGMVELCEDQILRGKDPAARAELARKVARLWQTELDDPREAADAWRRVLRMKSGDAEATAGLEHAKAEMLKRSASGSEPAPRPAAVKPPKPAARAPAPARAPAARPAVRTERGSGGRADVGYGDDEEVTKTASRQELEARSIASSPRPVQLTPVSDAPDSEREGEEAPVSERELLEDEERR